MFHVHPCGDFLFLQVVTPGAPGKTVALALQGALKGQRFQPLPRGAAAVGAR